MSDFDPDPDGCFGCLLAVVWLSLLLGLMGIGFRFVMWCWRTS